MWTGEIVSKVPAVQARGPECRVPEAAHRGPHACQLPAVLVQEVIPEPYWRTNEIYALSRIERPCLKN